MNEVMSERVVQRALLVHVNVGVGMCVCVRECVLRERFMQRMC